MKIDIIIPFYKVTKDMVTQLYNTIIQQTIISDCHIIFISDDSPNENLIINQFKNTKLNLSFARNDQRSGPGVARNKGIEKAVSEYCIFLDADDYFYDNTSLERLYNLISLNNKDIILFYSYCDIQHSPKINAIVSRNFILQNNIKYPPYFMGETQYFQQKIFHCQNVKNQWLQNTDKEQYIVYGLKDNNTHLLKEIIEYNNLIFNFCNIFPYVKLCYEIDNLDYIYQNIVRLLELYYTSNYHKVFLYYSLYQLYQKFPLIFKKAIDDKRILNISIDIQYYNKQLLYNYDNNVIYYKLEDQILKNQKDILNYLYRFYILYKDDFFARPVLQDMFVLFLKERKYDDPNTF